MSIEIIAPSLVPDTTASIWFMGHWAPKGPWVLEAIVPDGGGVEIAAFMPGEEGKMAGWIASRNANANIYFQVNPLLPSFTDPLLNGKSGKGVKAKKTDVAALAWIHADIDPRPISPGEDIDPQAWIRTEAARALKRLEDFRPRTTATTFSGGGVQAFWRLAEPIPINGDPALAVEAERYNRGMELVFDADHVSNCDRVMRLPGTINWPDAKKRAKGRIPWRAATIGYFADRAFPISDFAPLLGKQSSAAVTIQQARTVRISGAALRINSVNDLDRYGVDDRTKDIIVRAKVIIIYGCLPDFPKPNDNSRSEWVYDLLCNLTRANVPRELIYGIVTDPQFKISESVREKHPGAQDFPDVWRRIEDAEAKVASAPDAASPLTTTAIPNGIVMRAGELNSVLDEAERALLADGVPIYQRGELVRLSTVNTTKDEVTPNSIKRAEGSTILTPVTDLWLLQQMARSVSWYRVNSEGKAITADPKLTYASHLLARSGEWSFPVLKGLLSAPTLDRDGRIIQRPGYDGGSGLYLDFAPGLFPNIPDRPTLDDARTALEKIKSLLRGFPFENEISRAVAMSAVMTTLIRPSLKTAPGHAFDAPAMGSGKSKLVETAGIIATGHRPAAMSQGKNDEEDEKRLSTVLRAGDPIIWIDNCERPLQGDFLCSMLTQQTVQARILGESKRAILPTPVTVLVTGNNLVVAGDATRRIVKSRLDAKEERPDTRIFDWDCCVEALEDRPALVVAALTALRAYHVAGRPEKLKPMGGFEDWDWVRGALVWAGYADPAGSRETILDDDPRRNELGELMEAWEAVNADRPVTVASMNVAREYQPGEKEPPDEIKRLHWALVDASGQTKWNPKSIGWALRRHKDRVFEGRRFTSEGKGRTMVWRLVGAKALVPGSTAKAPDRLPGLDGE